MGQMKGAPRFLPAPEGVVELTQFDDGSTLGTDGGIVERKDGSLILMQGGGVPETGQESPVRRISTDGGQTWGQAARVDAQIGAGGVIRLRSGTLGMYGQQGGRPGSGVYFSTSPDEGETWTAPVDIGVYPDFRPMHHSMTQLQSGRILLVGYWEGLNATAPDAVRDTQTGWGLWRGHLLFMEGHRGVEMGICIAYYSDDEGRTWSQAEGGLFGWFDDCGVPNGTGGIIDVYEPTVAECKDGRVLMFMRSKTGRLVQSYSLNGGQTWFSVLPTELASSQSPPVLVRIPTTDDLLCVWNQVSCEEIRRGFLRGRLSVAISRDSGMSWENFRTLELQEQMTDAARIPPELPISRRVVGRPGLGQLPDGFAMFTYPNVDIAGDSVFIRYSRMWPKARDPEALETADVKLPTMWPDTMPMYEDRTAEMTGQGVMRRYPLSWFYG